VRDPPLGWGGCRELDGWRDPHRGGCRLMYAKL
jgi:hypothetical protein